MNFKGLLVGLRSFGRDLADDLGWGKLAGEWTGDSTAFPGKHSDVESEGMLQSLCQGIG